jgi:hypothetical protein
MSWYVTREAVKAALDIKDTARNNAQVDRCIEAATGQVTGLLRREFDPWTGTLRYPSPRGEVLWFGTRALVRLDSLTVDGTTVDTDDMILLPQDATDPPYDGIRADSTTAATLTGSDDYPVAITGLWGYDLTELTAGATAEALDATETGVDLTGAASAAVGVGSVIRIDSERMTVTARSQLSTGVTLSANVAASKSDTGLTVSSGAGVTVGETVMVDTEKMAVQEVAGNALLVTRAVDGTTLATHTSGATLYAPRTVTVSRGALGTTAATHADASAVHVWTPPALVGELALAYALTSLGQGQSGYARTTGSGDNERESSGRGLRQIKDDAVRTYKRWLTGSV